MNNYGVDTTMKSDPVYEEIFDQNKAKRKLELHSGIPVAGYENVQDTDEDKTKLLNGVNSDRRVTPTAPMEEEDHFMVRNTAVPNEYGILRDNLQKRSSVETGETFNKTLEDHQKDSTIVSEDEQRLENEASSVSVNAYAEFDDLIPVQRVGKEAQLRQHHSSDLQNNSDQQIDLTSVQNIDQTQPEDCHNSSSKLMLSSDSFENSCKSNMDTNMIVEHEKEFNASSAEVTCNKCEDSQRKSETRDCCMDNVEGLDKSCEDNAPLNRHTRASPIENSLDSETLVLSESEVQYSVDTNFTNSHKNCSVDL